MYKSKVIDVIKETHDTNTIRFERPAGFEYKAGQYCIFDFSIPGELVRRSYSLSSSPTEDFLEITVKHIPNGKMSTHMCSLRKGDYIEFNGPVGKWVFEESMKKVVLIAGGSGISPMRSIAKYIIDKDLGTELTIIYGSRTQADIILRDQFEEFNKLPNVSLFLTVDHPDDGWKFHRGFIDTSFVNEATKNNPVDKVYFLCGPPVMLDAIKKCLLGLNVPEANIKIDAWG